MSHTLTKKLRHAVLSCIPCFLRCFHQVCKLPCACNTMRSNALPPEHRQVCTTPQRLPLHTPRLRFSILHLPMAKDSTWLRRRIQQFALQCTS